VRAAAAGAPAPRRRACPPGPHQPCLPATPHPSVSPAQIHFQPDAQEQPIELLHHLRLYEEGEPQGVPLPANKKPVISVRGWRGGGGGRAGAGAGGCAAAPLVARLWPRKPLLSLESSPSPSPPPPAPHPSRPQEQVEELVFVEPHDAFYRRIAATPPRALAAPSIIAPHVGRPEFEGAELAQINEVGGGAGAAGGWDGGAGGRGAQQAGVWRSGPDHPDHPRPHHAQVRQRVAQAAAMVKNAAAIEAAAAQQAAQAAAAAAHNAAHNVIAQGQPMAM
jgi:hypothetical protein